MAADGAERRIDEGELARRKRWVEFTEDDAQRVAKLDEVAAAYAEPVLSELCEHLLEDAGEAESPRRAAVLQVEGLQREYFRRLTQGNYDVEFARSRIRAAADLERAGLDAGWYIGAYSFYIRAVSERVRRAFSDPDEALAAWQSLSKLIFLDIGLAVDTFAGAREQLVREQHQGLREIAAQQHEDAIRELSTPVLTVRAGLLILPIIGAIDSNRAQLLTQSVLTAIRDRRGRVVVIDITGVPAVDSAVANHIVQTVEACRLMGAQVILTGLSPEVAQTIVTLGIDLSKMQTVGDLESGIVLAERLMGYASPVLADGT